MSAPLPPEPGALVPGCLACDILSGKREEPGGVVYENDCWQVGSAMPPVVWPGFLIVKLKRHCEHIAQLRPEEAATLGPVLQTVSAALMQVLQPAKVYVCSFGEGTKHIHFWLLPRPRAFPPGMHPTVLRLDLRLEMARLPFLRSRVLISDAQTLQLSDRLRGYLNSQREQ